jgi:hypothetical protein
MNAYIIKNNDILRRILSYEIETSYEGNVLLFIQDNFADIFQRTETKIGDANYPNPIIKNVNPWTVWNNDSKLDSIRLQRNYLLSQTDWTALNDVPLSPEEKTAYENYRQQLRDFPDVVDLDLPIEEIIWPTKP